MAQKPLYPVFLDLNDVPVLLVGGGAVATRKAKALLAAGAVVTILALKIEPALRRLAARHAGRCDLRQGAYTSGALRGQRLIFAATNAPEINARIVREARALGLLVNTATEPAQGNVQVPAHVARGPLQLAISTGGASAALARSLRERLETAVGPEWGVWARLLQARRQRVLREIPDPAARRALLTSLGSPRWIARVKRDGAARTGRRLDELIRQAARRVHGKKD